jgi:hypothetical protein
MNRFSIKSTRFLGYAPGSSTKNWSILGQDGGQSIVLGDKKLFVFSDTLIKDRLNLYSRNNHAPPFRMPRGNQNIFLANCAGTSSKEELYPALSGLSYFTDEDGFPCQVLEPTDWEKNQKVRFWPEHGIYIDGKVYLYYLGIQTIDPNSIWGFRNLGTGLAVLDPETGLCSRLLHQGDWRFWRMKADDFHFGVQVIRREGFVYIFGSVRDALYSHARLARVDVSRVSDPTAYEYLSSFTPLWDRDINNACDLGRCSSDYSVSYNPYIRKFTMIYIDQYDGRLFFRKADDIHGPYSEPSIGPLVPRKESSELVYLAFEHPCFRKNNGKKIYISYCQPHFVSNSVISVTFY